MFDKELKIAKKIAYQSGDIMRKYFDGNQQNKQKFDGTELTVADTIINSFVISELSKNFDDGVIGEEESTTGYGHGRKWFCDPIDGTKSYVAGVPTAMFSLALVIDGRPVLGVAYDPFQDKIFTAVKSQGSYCNGIAINVSDKNLNDQFVGTTSDLDSLFKTSYINKIIEHGAKPISICGVVFKACLIANGRFVGDVEPVVGGHDTAAIEVIIKEAGGKITGFDGQPLDYTKKFKGAIVSNSVVHEQLLACAKFI